MSDKTLYEKLKDKSDPMPEASLFVQEDQLESPGLIIWLDDIRDPRSYGIYDAIWVKNSLDYKMLLIDCLIKDDGDSVEAIHFDNDLGEETEGYDLFLIIEEALHKGKFKGLKKIYVHSSNPSAVHKFMLAARGLKYHFGIEVIRNQY